MTIHYDFALLLTTLTIITGLGFIFDYYLYRRKSHRKTININTRSKLLDYCRSTFPIILVVWCVRSFVLDHFRVPTGSLEPTIMAGDFIAIKPYAYGLRFPVLRKKIVSISEPKRGDVAMFYQPGNDDMRLIKRVVGIPGDHIGYYHKTLYINGKAMTQTFVGESLSKEPNRADVPVRVFEENLTGVNHKIFIRDDLEDQKQVDLIVPQGYYFMMGDNRDESYDSRWWGLVPEKNLIGQAIGVWMSWDSNQTTVRWDRIGSKIS